MNFHGVTGATEESLVLAVRAVLTLMLNMNYRNTSYERAEYAPAGQNFMLPISWVPITTTTGADAGDDRTIGDSISFVGRSLTTGKRVRIFLYNTAFTIRKDMRIQRAEDTNVAAVCDELNSQNDVIGVIDGSRPNWYEYANFGVNDYWTRIARSTGG